MKWLMRLFLLVGTLSFVVALVFIVRLAMMGNYNIGINGAGWPPAFMAVGFAGIGAFCYRSAALILLRGQSGLDD